VKFVKGKKTGGAGQAEPTFDWAESKPAPVKPVNQTRNPWISRHVFDLMQERCVKAENMCRDLIRVIAVDDGEFLASHDHDYLAAGEAIKKGDV
jgi:hypothetical protein